MNKIELTADVVRVKEPQTFASGSQKVEVHLTWIEQGKDDQTFEQVVPIECWGSRVDTALGLGQGDTVKCDLYLSGREWKNPQTGQMRAFTSLRCGKLEVIEKAAKVSLKEKVMEKAINQNTEANDLPF